MAKGKKPYFGLGRVVSLILAIFIVTNVVFGVLIRIERGNILGVVLNIILFPIFWIIDLVTMIMSKDLTVLA